MELTITPIKTNKKNPFIIAIIICSLLILAVSIILYFTTKDSDSETSETTVVSDPVTDSESSIQIQITESYLAGLSSFSETIASLNDDYKTELNDYVNLDVESDNLLVICQALDICDEDKTELSDDEKTAIKNWIIDDGYFCLGTDCYVTNGLKYHSDTSEWTDKTGTEYNIQGHVEITKVGDELVIKSNNIPAHDITFENCKEKHNSTVCTDITEEDVCKSDSQCKWNENDVCEYILDCNFASANGYGETAGQEFTVPSAPTAGSFSEYTELSQTRDDAIMLDGVVVDIFSGGCYDLDNRLGGKPPDPNGNKKVGCMGYDSNDVSTDYYYLLDPAYDPNMFAVDDNNAHTQEGGHYHYHANPYPERGEVPDDEEPEVIGFAADGHPIYELWAGATSCYKLKDVDARVQLWDGDSNFAPAVPPVDGAHPLGMYIQDYEWASDGTCTLDEANGMERNGEYGYYVTSDYPYIIRKFRNDPHPSFCKAKTEDDSGECASSDDNAGHATVEGADQWDVNSDTTNTHTSSGTHSGSTTVETTEWQTEN